MQNCNGCSTPPLTDYASNPIYQELPIKNEYFTNTDERIYLDPNDSVRYTGELEKLRRDESNLVLKSIQ